MNSVLIILGILGFSSIVLAAYVLAMASRPAEGVGDITSALGENRRASIKLVKRSGQDRRKHNVVQFPVIASGQLIKHDRRKADRRMVLA